jgi:small subunit ribosomal protein S11
MAKGTTKTVKKRKVIVESTGEAHIVSSFNNIIIYLKYKFIFYLN